MKRTLWLFVICAAVVAGCSGPDAAKAMTHGDKPIAVNTIPALEVSAPVTVPILGAITAESRSNIGAEMDGRVVSLLVREGQHVKAGQALIQLAGDDAQTRVDAAKGGLQQAVLSAQADERIAEAKLLQAQLDFGRTQDRLSSEVKLADSRLAEAQAKYDQLKRGPRPQEIESANSDVTAAQLVVESNQATADFTKIILKRKSTVFAQGGISQNDVDQAQLDYNHAVQSVQFAQQQLRAKQLYLNLLKEGTPKEELAQGMAQLTAAKESFRAATANLASLDDARQVVTMATADHDRALARVKQLLSGGLSDEGAKVALAQQDLARTQIKTPIDGIVSSIKVMRGQVARAGQIVAEVIGQGGVRMEATAMDQDMGRIQSGEHVSITLRDLPGAKYAGLVQQVLPPGSEGRSSRVIVSILGGDHLTSGSVANGEVQTTQKRKLIQIPTSAIFNELDGEADVYVVSNGQARRRPIQIASKTSESVMIASGLTAGDVVVLHPASELHDGSAVIAGENR
jgi:RND family efflux transporter MFP subunit